MSILHERVVLSVTGPRFSPREAERQLEISFDTMNEPGDVASSGRYKGTPRPYGAGQILVAEGRPQAGILAAAAGRLALLAVHIAALRGLGAEDIVLHVDLEFDEQCNFELDPEVLRRVAGLGVPLTMTCYVANETGA